MSVCVCQSQPGKHRKLQTSHRLMYCTTQRDDIEIQYHAVPLDKSMNEIQDETQHTKKPKYKYSKNTGTCYLLRWYICMAGHALVEITHFGKMLFRRNNWHYSRDTTFVQILFHILQLQAFETVVRSRCKVKGQSTPSSPSYITL